MATSSKSVAEKIPKIAKDTLDIFPKNSDEYAIVSSKPVTNFTKNPDKKFLTSSLF